MSVSTHIRIGIDRYEKLKVLSHLLGKSERKINETLIDEFYKEVIDKPEMSINLFALTKPKKVKEK